MSEKRALTKFLRCVEWSDVQVSVHLLLVGPFFVVLIFFSCCMIFPCWQEAKQAIQLMYKWEMIDVCDALELLSPLFESEEVLRVPKFTFRHPGIFRCLLIPHYTY